MKGYVQKFSHAVSGIKVYGCDNEEVYVKVTFRGNNDMIAILSNGERICEYEINNDIDELNQVIDNWFMTSNSNMSNTEFVANNGSICPVCKSGNISVLDAYDDIVKCNKCKSKWYENTKVTGYTMIIKGEVDEEKSSK